MLEMEEERNQSLLFVILAIKCSIERFFHAYCARLIAKWILQTLFINIPGQGPGRDGFRQSTEMILSVSLDVQFTIEDLIAEGDKVVVRWMARGAYQGEFMGIPPTHKPLTIMGIDILRYKGGQRVETWRQFDMLGWLRQVGAMPPPGRFG